MSFPLQEWPPPPLVIGTSKVTFSLSVGEILQLTPAWRWCRDKEMRLQGDLALREEATAL